MNGRSRSAEQQGAEIDQAVESTGHLPGYYDADSEAYLDAVDTERIALRDDYVNASDDELLSEWAAYKANRGECFDAAEADDVLQIQHDMAIEAGDDHDPDTCPRCGA